MKNGRSLLLFIPLAGILIASVAIGFGVPWRPRPTQTPTQEPVYTETVIPTPTYTNTPTSTNTAHPTATVPIYKAKVAKPSYCYNGPSEHYLNATIVPANTEVDVLGMNSDSKNWFMIQGPAVGRCWMPSDFLIYEGIDTSNILVLTTALTTEKCPCRVFPKEGRQTLTNIPSGWRIVINAKSDPSADWVLVTPHDSTEQCWVAKGMLSEFVDGLLPPVALDVLIVSPPPTSTRRSNNGNDKPTPIHPSTAKPTSMQPTPVGPTAVNPTPIPPTPVPPTPVPPPTRVPPTPTLCWPPGHCK